jgi:hypothetical protein
MIQNDGKQNIFRQLQGWIRSMLQVSHHNTFDGGELNSYH